MRSVHKMMPILILFTHLLKISPMVESNGWSLATLVGWSTCTWLLVFDRIFGWDDELATCWSCTLSTLALAWLWSREPLAYTFELESNWFLSSSTLITSLGLISPMSMFFIALTNWVSLTSSRFSSSYYEPLYLKLHEVIRRL